jgi:Tfp pilus assembly protein PilZ
MSNRHGVLRRSGNVFDQKDFPENKKRYHKNNPPKKVSIINGSNEPTGKSKLMRYNTTFPRPLKLILNMSENEQLLLLKYAKSIIDERILPRNLCLIPVNCKLKEGNYNGLILDINSCGAYIDTNEHFPIGQEINLFFFNPYSHKNMQLDGKIIWSRARGIGVKFSDWSRIRYTLLNKADLKD